MEPHVEENTNTNFSFNQAPVTAFQNDLELPCISISNGEVENNHDINAIFKELLRDIPEVQIEDEDGNFGEVQFVNFVDQDDIINNNIHSSLDLLNMNNDLAAAPQT